MTDSPEKSMLNRLPHFIMVIMSLLFVGFTLMRLPSALWHEQVWAAAFLIMMVLRTPFSIRNRKNSIARDKNDATEAALLFGMFMGMMILPMVHIAFRPFSFADYTLPYWLTVAAAILQVPALFLFWRSHADLGRNWSPGLEVREDHSLVTRGVYNYMRHPMYAALWLLAITQPLLMQNWISGAFVVAVYIIFWFLRIPKEEAMMLEEFGDDYKAYQETTGRLWPKNASA